MMQREQQPRDPEERELVRRRQTLKVPGEEEELAKGKDNMVPIYLKLSVKTK